ncbi:MAG: DNA polymerase III subunit delta [Pseudomonadota bacterium]
MTALKGRAINAFLNKPDPSKEAVLLYGPDSGLVRERATLLAKNIVADLKDPFNYIELADADLKTDPTRLYDEATALSFSGGKRVIRLRTVGDGATSSAKSLINDLDNGIIKPNALILIEAGDLSKNSKLRKLFEGAEKATTIPCYEDGADDVRALAQQMAAHEGLHFTQDALDLTISLLGEDRGITRAELDKLILFAGPKETRPNDSKSEITIDTVSHCLVDTISDAMDSVANAATDGNLKELAINLYRSKTAGGSAIGLLRALQRSLARLQAAQQSISKGASPGDAMKRLRPPIFYKEQKAFANRLSRWPLSQLEHAHAILVETELKAKTTGAPQQEIIERAAFMIAKLGERKAL